MCAFERAEDTLRRLAMMRRFLIALVLVLFSGGVCGIELSKMRPKLSFGIAAQSAAVIAALVTGNGFDAGHQAQLCPCSTCIAGGIGLAPIVAVARAANLPESNGASSSMRGTRAALAGIRKIGDLAGRAKGEENDFVALKLTLAEFPSTEKAFKKLFDEYSQGISYKQQFLDKNAFLVYYTKGFDGPGRESIEKESPQEALQKMQYGYRNDAWIRLDDARAELDYLLDAKEKPSRDLRNSLAKLEDSVSNYIRLTSN